MLGARECEEMTVGWYDRFVLYALLLFSKLAFLCVSDSSFESGDLTGCLRDLLREGPSGMCGRSAGACDFLCSLQGEMERERVGPEEDCSFCKYAATGRRTSFCFTYGRVSGSSTDVNKRI